MPSDQDGADHQNDLHHNVLCQCAAVPDDAARLVAEPVHPAFAACRSFFSISPIESFISVLPRSRAASIA